MAALKDALSNLTDVSKQLNQESDEVNDLIDTVETAINAANPGVEVWLDEWATHQFREESYDVRIEDGFGFERHRSFWVLGYGRHRNKWRILARQDTENPRDLVAPLRQPEPLADCPRDVRVEAAPILEHLVEEITKRSQALLKGLQDAKARAK